MASQLTGLTYTLGATTLGNLTYSNDLAGRRISTSGSFARTGLPTPITTTAYNALAAAWARWLVSGKCGGPCHSGKSGSRHAGGHL